MVLFNIAEPISDDEVAREMSIFGPVTLVTKHAQVAGCREVYFADVRHASKATASLYPGQTGVHTINEVSPPS